MSVLSVVQYVYRFWVKVRRRSLAFAGSWKLRLSEVEWGEGLVLYGIPIIRSSAPSSIRLGKYVVLCSDSEETPLGVNHPVVLETGLPGATIVIGDHVGMSGASICAHDRIEIGSHCLLGANVMIVDTDFHPIEPQSRRHSRENVKTSPVVIEENVFLGANSVVLKGVRIGKNSVIGANSVVVRSIPSDTIAAGNPCRSLRRIDGTPFGGKSATKD
jgi:acetyltransferase-like isoleucine patch superfamily enzyme